MKEWCEKHPEKARERIARAVSMQTEETKKKIVERLVENNRTLEKRKALSEAGKKRWASGEMSAAKERADETLREGYRTGRLRRTDEQREKISAAIAQKYLSGGFRWARGKHVSPKTDLESYYRSSWELRRMRELDVDPAVEWWEHEPFWIPYELEGRTRRYLPDFYVKNVSGGVFLEEVGVGPLKDGQPKNLAKRAAAEAHCRARGWSFRVVSSFVGPPPAPAST